MIIRITFQDLLIILLYKRGIVGYRETSLLFRDGKNSDSSKQSVAFTIAHEIAHFWFGNLGIFTLI